MVSVAFVKDGQLYGHYAQITKPEPDKELQLKWTTFRDKLRPGQQEEWKLSVLYPDGRPADAELLAMMYDASLDRFYTHDLFFRGCTALCLGEFACRLGNEFACCPTENGR